MTDTMLFLIVSLLAVLIALIAVRIIQAEAYHKRDGEMFAAFATMVGDLLDDREGKEPH